MKFYTNILIKKDDEATIDSLQFKKINLSYEVEPTGKFFQSLDGKSDSIFSERANNIRNDQIPFKLLIIEAENIEIAEDFLSVLICSLIIIFPDVNMATLFSVMRTFTEKYYDKEYIDYVTFSPHYDFNIGLALKLTENCISDDNLVYSLEKYKISVHLFSFHPYSADPKYGNIFNNYSIQREQHANQAFAIISAFSVIEELGLEIRSSSKNKRFLDNKPGIWNPAVLSEITKRLIKSNIFEEMTFDWIFRGEKSNVENDLTPYFGFDSLWCDYGAEVRDKTLTFPEAIHNASYLRNFIASHKFNKLTQYINPFDVFNVQSLARKLFLEKTTFWEKLITR